MASRCRVLKGCDRGRGMSKPDANESKRRVLLVSLVPSHPALGGNRARILALAGVLRSMGYEVEFLYQDWQKGDCDAMQKFWGEGFHFLPYHGRRPWKRWGGVLRRVIGRLSKRVPRLGGHGARLMGVDDWYDATVDRFVTNRVVAGGYVAVVAVYITSSRALLACPPGVRRIIDTHELFALGREGASGNEHLWVRISRDDELRACQRADSVWAIQGRDAEILRKAGVQDVRTIGHFPEVMDWPARLPGRKGGILYVAANHSFNIEGLRYFADKIYSILKGIVDPKDVVVAGTIQQAVGHLYPFRFLGPVPDLRGLYEAARVVISPVISGTGLKIKNLEALGFGKAMVTTPFGAIGMEEGAGTAFLMGRTPEEFAAQVRVLLEDDSKCRVIMDGAVQYARAWNQRQLDELADCLEAVR